MTNTTAQRTILTGEDQVDVHHFTGRAKCTMAFGLAAAPPPRMGRGQFPTSISLKRDWSFTRVLIFFFPAELT